METFQCSVLVNASTLRPINFSVNWSCKSTISWVSSLSDFDVVECLSQ